MDGVQVLLDTIYKFIKEVFETIKNFFSQFAKKDDEADETTVETI